MAADVLSLFNIELTEKPKGNFTASLTVREPLLNAYKITHGGVHICVCNAAMQAAVGSEAAQIGFTIDYYGKVPLGERLKAAAHIVKNGRTCVFVQASLWCQERLVAQATAVFLRRQAKSARETPVLCAHQERPKALIALDKNQVDERWNADDALLVKLFNQYQHRETVSRVTGEVCVSYKTDEAFVGADGFLDHSLCGVLIDNAMGLACVSQTGRALSVRLSMQVFEDIRPPVVLTCLGKLERDLGPLAFCSGTVWADDRPVATCEGIFAWAQSDKEDYQVFNVGNL